MTAAKLRESLLHLPYCLDVVLNHYYLPANLNKMLARKGWLQRELVRTLEKDGSKEDLYESFYKKGIVICPLQYVLLQAVNYIVTN